MCNATHSRPDALRAAAIARNCAECVRGRGTSTDFDADPLGALRRLTRGVPACEPPPRPMPAESA